MRKIRLLLGWTLTFLILNFVLLVGLGVTVFLQNNESLENQDTFGQTLDVIGLSQPVIIDKLSSICETTYPGNLNSDECGASFRVFLPNTEGDPDFTGRNR